MQAIDFTTALPVVLNIKQKKAENKVYLAVLV
jgi:hypothetical protein